jgi:nucleotide-binding universal stress UspA family protein
VGKGRQQPREPGHAGALRRILVATDFSTCAGTALEWAIEIARAHGARIDLLHAIERVPGGPGAAEVRGWVERSLAALEGLVRRAGVEGAAQVRERHAWDAVAAAEQEIHPDLIVIGARGRTAYARPFLGSRADRILRTAGAPVLTVHPGDAGRQARIPAVVIATDFSEEAALATSAALRLARALPGPPRIVLVHAWEPVLIFDGPLDAAAMAAPINDAGRDEARKLLESAAAPLRDGTIDVQAVVRDGYAATVIEEEAAARGAGIVALGTRGRSGLRRMLLGSIAERVVHHAQCPVLTVRRPDPGEPMRLAEEAEIPG